MKCDSIWSDGVLEFSAPRSLEVQFVGKGNDLGISFSNWQLELQGDSKELSVTQAASVRVPINVSAQQVLVGYAQTLEVGIERTAGVRGFVVADFAGSSYTLEFGFEPPAGTVPGAGNAHRFWNTFSHAGLELGNGTGLAGPAADYQASIMVTLRRRTLSDSAVITIGSLDVVPVLFAE